MKNFITGIILLGSLSVHAWENVATCDGGEFVIDRQQNEFGRFDYQAVFRRGLVEAMLEKKIVSLSSLNHIEEVIVSVTPQANGVAAAGLLPQSIGFLFSREYNREGKFNILFHRRGVQLPLSPTFENCTFKFRNNFVKRMFF